MKTLVAPGVLRPRPRPIWTPPRRKVRWCPVHRRTVNMADGDVLLDADGNVILDDNGAVQLSDGAGDACCCGGEPCEFCSDGTPASFEVDIAGWSRCGCVDTSEGGSWQFTAGSINGSYTATQMPANACGWLYDQPISGITLTEYDALGCTGNTIVTSSGWHLIIQITLGFGGTIKSLVNLEHRVSGVADRVHRVFDGEMAFTLCRATPYNMSNLLTSGDCGTGTSLRAGYGGTLTAEGT